MPWLRRFVPTCATECTAPANQGDTVKTEAAVKDRLTKEINHWDHRAGQLKAQEAAGTPNARPNSGDARKRADGSDGLQCSA